MSTVQGNDVDSRAHAASPIITKERDVATMLEPEQAAPAPRKKRICRFPGCTNSIKSHGHCQKHGAKPKRCKVPGCEAQRQSGFDDMCKRHWRDISAPPEMRREPTKTAEEKRSIEPQGKSVYDDILPASFKWKGDYPGGKYIKVKKVALRTQDDEGETNLPNDEGESRKQSKDYDYEFTEIMPLAKFLIDNAHREAGWHRKDECLARGLLPPLSLKCKLEEWESQIAVIEMALLVGLEGNASHGSRDSDKYQNLLSHAWGRDKTNFRKHLVNRLCSRRGELRRKRRSDAGTTVPEEKRAIAVAKSNATKAARKKMKLEAAQNDQTAVGSDFGWRRYNTIK